MLLECSRDLIRDIGYMTQRPTGAYAPEYVWIATGFRGEKFDKWILLTHKASGFCVVTQNDMEIPDFAIWSSGEWEGFDASIILDAIKKAFLAEGYDEKLVTSYLNEGQKLTAVQGASDKSMMNRLNRWKKAFQEAKKEDFLSLAAQFSHKKILIDKERIIPSEVMKKLLEAEKKEISAEMIPFATMKIRLRLPAPLEVYRHLEVPLSTTLEQLHEIIQNAFGWEDAHLHQFEVGPYIIAPQEDGNSPIDIFDEEDLQEADITVEDVAQSWSEFTYTYDFGDNWEHTIKFSKRVLRPLDAEVVCTDGAGDTPWEDCGGPYGYQYMIDVLKNPFDPEYESISEWTSDNGQWGREFFLEEINEGLKGILSRPKRPRFF